MTCNFFELYLFQSHMMKCWHECQCCRHREHSLTIAGYQVRGGQNAQIKKRLQRKMFGAPNNWGIHPFQTPVSAGGTRSLQSASRLVGVECPNQTVSSQRCSERPKTQKWIPFKALSTILKPLSTPKNQGMGPFKALSTKLKPSDSKLSMIINLPQIELPVVSECPLCCQSRVFTTFYAFYPKVSKNSLPQSSENCFSLIGA